MIMPGFQRERDWATMGWHGKGAKQISQVEVRIRSKLTFRARANALCHLALNTRSAPYSSAYLISWPSWSGPATKGAFPIRKTPVHCIAHSLEWFFNSIVLRLVFTRDLAAPLSRASLCELLQLCLPLSLSLSAGFHKNILVSLALT